MEHTVPQRSSEILQSSLHPPLSFITWPRGSCSGFECIGRYLTKPPELDCTRPVEDDQDYNCDRRGCPAAPGGPLPSYACTVSQYAYGQHPQDCQQPPNVPMLLRCRRSYLQHLPPSFIDHLESHCGHYYATVLPRRAPYEELEDYVRPQTSYGSEPFEFHVGRRPVAWTVDADIVLAPGDVITVVSHGRPGPHLHDIETLFAPDTVWGSPEHTPRAIYTPGLCVLHKSERFMLHQRFFPRQEVVPALAQTIHVPEDAFVQAAVPLPNLDLQGDPASVLVGVVDLPRQALDVPTYAGRRDVFTFCDLRPVGRQPQLHFSHSRVLHVPTLLALFAVRVPSGYHLEVDGARQQGDEIYVLDCALITFRLIPAESRLHYDDLHAFLPGRFKGEFDIDMLQNAQHWNADADIPVPPGAFHRLLTDHGDSFAPDTLAFAVAPFGYVYRDELEQRVLPSLPQGLVPLITGGHLTLREHREVFELVSGQVLTEPDSDASDADPDDAGNVVAYGSLRLHRLMVLPTSAMQTKPYERRTWIQPTDREHPALTSCTATAAPERVRLLPPADRAYASTIIPTPCRAFRNHATTWTSGDVANYLVCGPTLLEECIMHTQQPLFEAWTLLETLSEHIQINTSVPCVPPSPLSLSDKVPMTSYQADCLSLEQLLPHSQPTVPHDEDWLDTDLQAVLSNPDVCLEFRQAFSSLITWHRADRPAPDALDIYTDGSASNNDLCVQPGSWAFVVFARHRDQRFFVGGAAATTVPPDLPHHLGEIKEDAMTGELLALCWSLAWVAQTGHSFGVPVHFHYDSTSAGGGVFGLTTAPTGGLDGTYEPLSKLALTLRFIDMPRPYTFGVEADLAQRHAHRAATAPQQGIRDVTIPEAEVLYDITAISFNALTLRDPKTKRASATATGLRIAGRKEVLKTSLAAHQPHIIGLQETRLPASDMQPDDACWIYNAAADSSGVGTSRPMFFLIMPDCTSAHNIPLSEIRLFWAKRIQELAARPKGADYLILCDSNARVGTVESCYVGACNSESENPAGALFHEFLSSAEALAPATFEAYHSGPGGTWCSPFGQWARLDYVLVPSSWGSFDITSKVLYDVEVLQKRDDHVPVFLRCRFARWQPKSSYSANRRRAVRPPAPTDSAARLEVRQHLNTCTAVPWGAGVDEHYAHLAAHWRTAAEQLSSPATEPPRQPFLTQTTLDQVRYRSALRAYLRSETQERHRRLCLIAFAAFLHHKAGTSFTPTTRERAEVWLRQLDYSEARALHALHVSTSVIRRAVAQDRHNYLAGLAEVAATKDLSDPAELYKAIRRAFPQAQASRRSSHKPLPALMLEEGRPALTTHERAEGWRSHFERQEAGSKVTPEEYLNLLKERTRRAPWTFDIHAVPDLCLLESLTHSLKRHKAAGPDGITAEVLRLDVATTARQLLPILAKAAIRAFEPVPFRGGDLVLLAKRASHILGCEGYRSVLVSSVPGKLYHKCLRRQLLPAFCGSKTPFHAGILPGQGIELISLTAKTFFALSNSPKASKASLVFFDLKAAFYQTVRQLLVDTDTGDAELLQLFARMQLPQAAIVELKQKLVSITTLEQCQVSSHTRALISDLFTGSWFRLSSFSELTVTRRGTRPRDPAADLLFAFSLSAYMRSATTALEAQDLLAELPGPGERPPYLQHQGPVQLQCPAWADDFFFPQTGPTVPALLDRTQRAVSLLVTHASSLGMTVKAGEDKTALLLPPGEAHNEHELLHTGPEGKLVLPVVDDTTAQRLDVPVVQAYKHLGGVLTANQHPAPDLHYRYSRSMGMIKPLRRRLFGAQCYDMAVRRSLLRALSVSRYVHTAAALVLPAAVHRRLWERQYVSLWRVLLARTAVDAPPHSYAVLLAARAPPPNLAIADARALCLQKLFRQGPQELLAFLYDHWCLVPRTSWLRQLEDDIRSVAVFVPGVKDCLPSHQSVLALLEAHESDVYWWRKQVARATKQFLQDAEAWQEERKAGKLPVRVGPADGSDQEYQCYLCDSSFPLRKHLHVHLARTHRIYSPARHYAISEVCTSCLRVYPDVVQAQQHLKHSTECLRRALYVHRPLTYDEILALEQPVRTHHQRLRAGKWQQFSCRGPPRRAPSIFGPRAPTAEERLHGLEDDDDTPISDLGQTAFSEATCRDVAKVQRSEGLDLGVLLGDLSYADTDATRWDSFQRLFDESGCADIPWVVLPGNHEIEPDEITGEPFLPFRSRWRTPQSREAAVSVPPEDAWQGWLTYDFPSMSFDFGSSFFSLEVGCAHLLVLNPYTDASPSSPQITWLQSELKRINRSKTEHVAVLTHAPWQHSSRAHRPEMEAATRNLLSAAGPLLLPDKIDLVFSGHVHAFERSLPMDGVQHFVVGHGGNMEGLYDNWLPSSTSAFHAGDHYGWGLLHLRPRRLGPSTFNARRGADGAVMDAVEFWPRDLRSSQPSKDNQGAGAPEPGLLGATFAACLVVCLCACFYRRARVRARYEEESSLRRAEEGEAAVVTGDSEAEAIFREAYEAEAERAKLLSKQVEAALAEQLGAPEGIKINVEAPAAPAPGEPGGSTWRFAYEAVKKRTASLEGQLEKARRIAAPAATPPADPTAAAVAEAEANFVAPDVSTQNLESGNAQPNFQQPQQGNMMDPMQQMQKLREVGSLAEDEESVLRLLTLGTLPNQENAFSLDPTATKKELPPLNRAREALSSEDFVANDAIVFERSYIFPGVIPDGRDPAVALESLQTRMAGIQAPGATETELFLQPQKEEGKSLLIMVHKGDLPDGEIESWQWVVWVLSVGATFVSSLSTTLAVVAVGPGLAAGSDVGDLTAAFEKLVPVAGAVLATVAAQETARRTVASNYKVELTPPYLLPTLLSGSIGCLGTLTRRLSTAPNREAEVNMSLAAPIAGLIVSLGFMAAGLAMGPGTDRHITTTDLFSLLCHACQHSTCRCGVFVAE
ncbi:PAP20 [Symbiodinium sp. CCMP2592]|nr:PAP20 [Symbiodinium sp. CCMP2592]